MLNKFTVNSSNKLSRNLRHEHFNYFNFIINGGLIKIVSSVLLYHSCLHVQVFISFHRTERMDISTKYTEVHTIKSTKWSTNISDRIYVPRYLQ